MRTEFVWTLEDGILFGSMTLEKGSDRLSRNFGKDSFWIRDPWRWDWKVVPETSVRFLIGFLTLASVIEKSRNVVLNYHYSLRNNPEERNFKFLNSAYLTKVLCRLLKEHIDLSNVVCLETGPCDVAYDVRCKESFSWRQSNIANYWRLSYRLVHYSICLILFQRPRH